eukprot:237382-Ditylum_brightwellii.AAC.1
MILTTLQCPFSKLMFVFAAVLVQDKSNGRTTTIVDNRAALKIKQMAGGSDEASKVFGNLLGGGGKK